MTTSKSLPARPSLESLRKQAKKLASEASLSHRHAQLALAREYGFAGWQELVAEVQRRLGHSLEWAASRARQIIHDNDVEQLKQLLTEHPALLSWRGEEDEGGLLGMATTAFGDSGDPEREQWFTRAACAELLIDAGAIVLPSVCDSIAESRAKGLLQLFERRGMLPRTLKFRVALGDVDGIRVLIESGSTDFATVNEAFGCACRFGHEPIASALLDRLTALDAELGRRIDDGPGRAAFIKALTKDKDLTLMNVEAAGPWQTFLMRQVVRALHTTTSRLLCVTCRVNRGCSAIRVSAFRCGWSSERRGEIMRRRSSPRYSISIPHSCDVARRRVRRRLNLCSPIRRRIFRRIFSRCSRASGRYQTTCLTRPAWETSSE
jgi:hypothetical protein